MESEGHWSKKAGTFFNKEPSTNAKDIRDEVVLLYRASFAIVRIIAPFNTYKYKPNYKNLGIYDILFSRDQKGIDLFEELDKVVMHDAVLNVAMIWKDIWVKFD